MNKKYTKTELGRDCQTLVKLKQLTNSDSTIAKRIGFQCNIAKLARSIKRRMVKNGYADIVEYFLNISKGV